MRPVHPRERAFLARYFGGSLDIDRIRLGSSLGSRCWSPFGNRISLTVDLYEQRDARAPVRLDEPRVAAVFAHEALHVWQRQHGRAVTREGARLQAGYALGRFDPYEYDRGVLHPASLLALFVLGNIERQGRIFEDYVWAAQSGRDVARFAKVAAWVRGAGA